MSIVTASITYNSHGTPVADAFDDVYFSNHDGMAETEHVFINSNALPERWRQHPSSNFITAETGFGTGLNFLTAVKHFVEFRREHPAHHLDSLHFISFEKFPITRADLSQSLQQWPDLSEIATQLLAQYPPAIAGCHRLHIGFQYDFPCKVVLDLWLGDVNALLPALPESLNETIDAWFLDGFAPAKNPDMWQQNLFNTMAKLTHPNGTFATFTAAGFVKRGLKAAGFTVEKCRGFGKKRDMLRGILNPRAEGCSAEQYPAVNPKTPNSTAFWHRAEAAQTRSSSPSIADQTPDQTPHQIPDQTPHQIPHHIAIVGGGLAGLNTAYALLKKGYQVTLLDSAPSLAAGASGNRQGGFYPQLNVDFSLSGQLYSQCFNFARQQYQAILANGFHFEHDFCGVLQLAFNETQFIRHQKFQNKGHWPTTLIRGVSAEEAQQIAGVELPCGGMFIPDGGWINPAQLVQALANACHQYQQFSYQLNCAVEDLLLIVPSDREQPQWRLTLSAATTTMVADSVVLANSFACQQFRQCEGITIQPVRGQVEHLPQINNAGQLKTVLCHKGYLTPTCNGIQTLGATFDKDQIAVDYRPEDEQRNINTAVNALPDAKWLRNITPCQSGRASIRGTTSDHLPLLGNVPNLATQMQQYRNLNKRRANTVLPHPAQWPNLFMLAGLGSRGLCTAPLLAEALACQISGSPLPLSQPQLNALSPNRFLIKQLIRGETIK